MPILPPLKFDVTCRYCLQGKLAWGWNFQAKKPVLVHQFHRVHLCPNENSTQDIFPGWCDVCNAADLLFVRRSDQFELVESYGLPHTCEQEYVIKDLNKGTCKYCKSNDLLWIRTDKAFKFNLIDSKNHQRHTCPELPQYIKDYAEAYRMNYRIEKAWINSFPDNHICKYCKGKSYKMVKITNKRILAKFNTTGFVMQRRSCKRCKHIGLFSAHSKKEYLKHLRKQYWPWKQGKHKWKKFDNPTGL